MTSIVLYVDHAGHLAPLSRCFYATASRRLSSLSDRQYPSTTTTEVDSAFCPQCLAFQDAASAASSPFCKSCQQCPLCRAVASTAMEDNQAFFRCGYCSWTSKECNLTVLVSLGDSEMLPKEKLLKAREELLAMLQIKKEDSEALNHYNNMSIALEHIAKDELKRRKNVSQGKSQKTGGTWSLEALEASIRIRQEKKQQTITGEQSLIPINTERSLDISLDTVDPTTLLFQSTCTLSKSHLLPLPMLLRPRLSRRCRAELQEGRPGILVKPKLNPLEGDSSLRSGYGQWWKKDSSAIHVVPRMTIVQTTDVSMLVKVTNPTLGVVKLRLGMSSMTQLTIGWSSVVVDSLSGKTMDIHVLTTPIIQESPTSVATLEAVEDLFLDMNQLKVPDAVATFGRTGKTRLVATQADTAWFEVAGGQNAILLSLQIQVGDGSWESSLIKKQPSGDEMDFCNFDVVLVPRTFENK